MLTNHTFALTTPSWNIYFLINNIKKNCRCQQLNEEILEGCFALLVCAVCINYRLTLLPMQVNMLLILWHFLQQYLSIEMVIL